MDAATSPPLKRRMGPARWEIAMTFSFDARLRRPARGRPPSRAVGPRGSDLRRGWRAACGRRSRSRRRRTGRRPRPQPSARRRRGRPGRRRTPRLSPLRVPLHWHDALGVHVDKNREAVVPAHLGGLVDVDGAEVGDEARARVTQAPTSRQGLVSVSHRSPAMARTSARRQYDRDLHGVQRGGVLSALGLPGDPDGDDATNRAFDTRHLVLGDGPALPEVEVSPLVLACVAGDVHAARCA